MPAPILARSAAPTRWIATATWGATLTGSDTAREQLAANNTQVTLVGGKLDDTYIAYDWSTKIVEQAGGGVDTVLTWGQEVTLGANVENITLMGGANSRATGNSGNNLITGNDGNNVITTGGGNDVLVGSKGYDTYIPTKAANTTTWITGFKTGSAGVDTIDLVGYGISSFSGVQSRMTQVGADLRIDLGNGQQIMLENKTKAQLTAANFKVEGSAPAAANPPSQPSQPSAPSAPSTPSATPTTPSSSGAVSINGMNDLVLTFADEFNSLKLYSTWQPYDAWGNRSLPSNGELQYYVDPQYKGLGLNPFSVDNGILTITAAKTAPENVSKLWGYQYTSGQLSSHDSFSQKYGYFEIKAQVTDQQGMWPVFWLLSTNKTWPPEIDILEMIGSQPYSVHQTVHTGAATNSGKETKSATNLADGFHTYGVDWTASKITFYFDGKPTHTVATPADMHTPMYMLLDIAVGGKWPGSPNASTDWSQTNMKVDYIRVYQHGGTPVSTPTPAPTPTPTPDPAPAAQNPPASNPTPTPTTPDPAPTPTTPSAGFKAVLSNEMDPNNLNSSFTVEATGANSSKTYNASQMNIKGIDKWATVTAAYDANNGLTLTNKGIWNAVKNARVESESSGSVTINNFVDTQIALGNGADTVTVKGAKRGSISTGGGNDQIAVSAQSNATTENLMKIDAGDGNDTVGFSGASNTKVAIVGGAGNDKITVSGQAGGTVNAGSGDDRITASTSGSLTVAGGAGKDVFEFIRSAHATISDFNAAEDSILIRGGSSSNTQVKAGNGFTTIDLGNGASVTLAGVTVPQSGINIAYA